MQNTLELLLEILFALFILAMYVVVKQSRKKRRLDEMKKKRAEMEAWMDDAHLEDPGYFIKSKYNTHGNA